MNCLISQDISFLKALAQVKIKQLLPGIELCMPIPFQARESTCDTLSSSAANQCDNTVSVAHGGNATPGSTKQLLPLVPNPFYNKRYT